MTERKGPIMNKNTRSLIAGILVSGMFIFPAASTAAAAGKAKKAAPAKAPIIATPTATPGKKGLTSDDLAKVVQAIAYEKSTGAVSKMKGVFKKSAKTVTVKFTFTNKSKKAIQAVRGWLRFATYFNESIYDFSLEAVMPIEPGAEAGMSWKLKPADFPSPEAYKKFVETPLEKMKQIWVPKVIILEDGTTLKAK
jgi:hypothetical protein